VVKKSEVPAFKYLNVIMHGVFGYVLNPKEKVLHALTPAVFPHVYSARNYGATKPPKTKDAHSVPLHGDYTLTGIQGKASFNIDKGTPSIPAKKSKIKYCDYYCKRRFSVDLPFPTGDGSSTGSPYFLLDSFNVGSIYRGLAAEPLNNIGMDSPFPSLFCFVYKVNAKEALALVPRVSQPSIRIGQPEPKSIPLDFLIPSESNASYANLHIMGGLDPAIMTMRKGKKDDHAPHARRAFASLVDMFDELPLTLEIPDGFAPQRIFPPLPKGVTLGDIEKGGDQPRYGHANCHSATFVIDNR
jgi:hypothetical protein